MQEETIISLATYESVYHQLMLELVQLKVMSFESAKGMDGAIKMIYKLY